MKLLVSALAAFVFFVSLQSHEYEPSNIKPEDVLTVLQSCKTFKTPELAAHPADITFACADIKFDGKRAMICECGDGIYMSLRPTNVEFAGNHYWEVSPFWGLVWPYLTSFGLPVWHVEDRGPKNALALEVLAQCGGKYAPSFLALAQDARFKKCTRKNFKPSSSIKDYAGIIVYRAKDERARDGAEFVKFRQHHPEFIYVNETARYHIIRKHTTYKLFQDAGLDAFVPKNVVHEAVYDENLARIISSEIKQEKIVIKPTFSSLSMGVNVVDKKGLDQLLKLIFKDKHLIPKNAHRCHNYWRSTFASKHFVAAEHMQSKRIYKDGKPYDPTMRVVFVMHHDKGSINVNILGGFWKIPVKPLDDKKATLTEKHVTIAHAGDEFTGILLEADDAQKLKDILTPALAQAYKYLIKTY